MIILGLALVAMGAMLSACASSDGDTDEIVRADHANLAKPESRPKTVADLAPVEREAYDAALARGDENMKLARWEDAAEAYAQALEILPGSTRAIEGQFQALARRDLASPLEANAREIQLRREAALAEFDSAYIDARAALANDDLGYAHGRILSAKVQLERNRSFLRAQEYRDRQDQAALLLGQIEQARELAEHGAG